MIKLDFNLLINIVNLLILCFLLKKFLIKPVRNIMDKREEIIANGLQNAKDTQTEAQQLKQDYEAKLQNAEDEAKNIVSNSKREAQMQYDKTVEKAEAQAKQILSEARKSAEAEQEKAFAEAKTKVAELAVDIAAKLTAEASDEASNKKAYDKFIKEAGDIDDK